LDDESENRMEVPCPLQKKSFPPSEEEIKVNSRSRSAKLRVAVRVSAEEDGDGDGDGDDHSSTSRRKKQKQNKYSHFSKILESSENSENRTAGRKKK